MKVRCYAHEADTAHDFRAPEMVALLHAFQEGDAQTVHKNGEIKPKCLDDVLAELHGMTPAQGHAILGT